MLAVIVLVVTPGATSTSAAAEGSDTSAVRVSGEFICVAAALTEVTTDPDDPTRITGGKFESSSLLFGDFVGVDRTEGTFTFDPDTGELSGDHTDTFHGIYKPDGSAGIIRREGPFEGNLNTNETRFNQRITGGEVEFEGSRGHLTVLGFGVPGAPCVGTRGTYDGVWARP